MKRLIASAMVAGLCLPVARAAAGDTTFVGVITDTMCTTDHKPMNIAPDESCVRACVGDAKTYFFAIATSAGTYALSDQSAPAGLVGHKVKVTGTLYPKTKIVKVLSITPLDEHQH